MSHFDVVKAARAILSSTKLSRSASEATVADYEMTSWRLINAANMDVNEIVRLAADTTRTTTWHKRRAALLYHCRFAIHSIVADQDILQRWLKSKPENAKVRAEWEEMIKEIDFYVRLHNAVQEAKPVAKENRTRRHSKKHDLGGLPADWREVLLQRMGPTYYMHYLVTACCGCRPSEMLSPVELRIEGAYLTATITGKKVTNGSPDNASHGQPWRKLYWVLPSTGIVELLAGYVHDEGGLKSVGFRNESGPKNFSTAVRDAARRLWPARSKTITPYCLRHAFSADMKAAKMSREDIAAALGHVVDTTSKYYGPAQQGRPSGIAPDRIDAARKVRKKYVHCPPEKPRPVAP